jgi:hypothetical protein
VSHPSPIMDKRGTIDSETMFCLALTFGLEDDPVDAVERMVGFVEETGQRHRIEDPIQMTVATTDGRSVWVFRYSSERDSRTLYASTRMDDLRALYPESEELARLSDQTRVVVSEPLGDPLGSGTRCRNRTWGSSRPARTSCGRSPPGDDAWSLDPFAGSPWARDGVTAGVGHVTANACRPGRAIHLCEPGRGFFFDG